MPADHLNTPVAALVKAVLNLTDDSHPAAVAAEAGIDVATLLSAAETYHDAGELALHDRPAEPGWLQAHVTFTDWDNAHHTAADRLLPALEQLRSEEIATRWWYIRKHPHWRLRVQAAGHDTTEVLAHRLDSMRCDLIERQGVTGWQPTIYEPEAAAFGGTAGMNISHDLFAADSRHTLTHLTQDEPAVGVREATILLITSLCRGAGLDWFEIGDVWRRVATLRPLPTDIDTTRMSTLAANVVTLLERDTSPTGPLFAPGSRLHGMADWVQAFRSAGAALASAAAAGQLRRGLRAVAAHHVIFHWNRLGLDARQQTLLAHAARDGVLSVDASKAALDQSTR